MQRTIPVTPDQFKQFMAHTFFSAGHGASVDQTFRFEGADYFCSHVDEEGRGLCHRVQRALKSPKAIPQKGSPPLVIRAGDHVLIRGAPWVVRETVEFQISPQAHEGDAESLYSRFGQWGAPLPGEKGYRAPPFGMSSREDLEAWISSAFDKATHLIDSPEGINFMIWALERDGYEPETIEEDAEFVVDYMDIPVVDADGKTALPFSHRTRLAAYLIFFGVLFMPKFQSGFHIYDLPEGLYRAVVAVIPDDIHELAFDGTLRPELKPVLVSAVADYFQGLAADIKKSLRLVIVDKTEAVDFISKHHSALPDANMAGFMYAMGVRQGFNLVAVATVNSPTGAFSRQVENQAQVVELTRIASNGEVMNASSMLAARARDLAARIVEARGAGTNWLFVTYSLCNETGATYKSLMGQHAKEWIFTTHDLRPVDVRMGKELSGARLGRDPTSLANIPKVRWQAGPLALPADPRWEEERLEACEKAGIPVKRWKSMDISDETFQSKAWPSLDSNASLAESDAFTNVFEVNGELFFCSGGSPEGRWAVCHRLIPAFQWRGKTLTFSELAGLLASKKRAPGVYRGLEASWGRKRYVVAEDIQFRAEMPVVPVSPPAAPLQTPSKPTLPEPTQPTRPSRSRPRKGRPSRQSTVLQRFSGLGITPPDMSRWDRRSLSVIASMPDETLVSFFGSCDMPGDVLDSFFSLCQGRRR